MRIRTLERSDVREGFECGEPSLDVYIERYAWQNQNRHHLGVTYVAVDDATRRILGYFTLAAASITSDNVQPRGAMAAYPVIPVIRIARLAVDRRVQGIGLGAELLHAAFAIAWEQSRRIGCAGVIVDALRGSEPFYERYGFQRGTVLRGSSGVRPRPTPMYLELGMIEQSLSGATEGASPRLTR